ncbi:desulfoferrodoxin family protein [Candidatus Cryosericum odellii]
MYSKPDVEPKAEFADISLGMVYKYCNLHGLWKADF